MVWLFPVVVVCEVLVVVVVVVWAGELELDDELELDGTCATATATASSRMDVRSTTFLMQFLRRFPALGRAGPSKNKGEALLKTS
jgi:hypothetical protein